MFKQYNKISYSELQLSADNKSRLSGHCLGDVLDIPSNYTSPSRHLLALTEWHVVFYVSKDFMSTPELSTSPIGLCIQVLHLQY